MNTGGMRSPAIMGKPVQDPAQWLAADLASNDDWIVRLSGEDISGLKALAGRYRHRHGDDPNSLLETSKADLDLGSFTARAEQIAHEIKDGKGLVLIRGLPVTELEPIDLAIIYWAIGLSIGIPASNNPSGDMIGHVTDLGKDMNNPKHRGYQTRVTMDYHTDQANVVGLLCMQTSKSGGQSKIVSSIAVYNELIKRRPDLLKPLTENYCWSMMGEVDKDQAPYYLSPIFNFLDEYLCVSSGPVHIIKGHNLPETPDMTPIQAEALQLLEDICEELHFAMDLEQGDIQLLNNMVVLHTREAYEDWPERERKRLLWRLWLTMPGIRPLTPYMEHWRKGLVLKNTQPHISLTPSDQG